MLAQRSRRHCEAVHPRHRIRTFRDGHHRATRSAGLRCQGRLVIADPSPASLSAPQTVSACAPPGACCATARRAQSMASAPKGAGAGTRAIRRRPASPRKPGPGAFSGRTLAGVDLTGKHPTHARAGRASCGGVGPGSHPLRGGISDLTSYITDAAMDGRLCNPNEVSIGPE